MLWLAHLLLEDDGDTTRYAVFAIILIVVPFITALSILRNALNAVTSYVAATLNAEE